MPRVAWTKDFPDVFVNAPWSSYEKKVVTLKDHPLYNAAKGQRDVGAAIEIIDELASRQAILNLFDFVEGKGVTPKIVAPSCQPGDSNNALGIGYAQWLSHEHGWPVETEIFQKKTIARDKSPAWTRIANRCEFYGEIDKATPYVLWVPPLLSLQQKLPPTPLITWFF